MKMRLLWFFYGARREESRFIIDLHEQRAAESTASYKCMSGENKIKKNVSSSCVDVVSVVVSPNWVTR